MQKKFKGIELKTPRRFPDRVLKDGTRRVDVRLKPDEYLLVIKRDSFYRLGCQFDDVVGSGVIVDCTEVYWNQYQQKWVDE